MLRKLFLVLIWILGSLIILVVLFCAEEDWRGKHAWETYKRQREAKGDSFEWSSIVPPPVPDDQNFAATPLFVELFSKPPQHVRLDEVRLPDCLSARGDWHVGRVENLSAWQTCFGDTNRAVRHGRRLMRGPENLKSVDLTTRKLYPTNQANLAIEASFTNINLLVELAKLDSILNEVDEAIRRPYCRFPIRYEDGLDVHLPHLNRLRNLASVYRLRALAELAASRSDAAFDDVQTCLRLADTLKDESLLISFLVRWAILDMTTQPLWEGLAAHQWSEGQLAALQARFQRVDEFDNLAKAMQGERLIRRNSLAKSFDLSSSAGGDSRLDTWLRTFVFSGWVYQNQLTFDRFYTETLLPAVDWEHRLVSPRKLVAADQMLLPAIRNTRYRALLGIFDPSIAGFAKKTAVLQNSMDDAAVACALERYRVVHGEFPKNLDTLVPQFIGKLPHDVINGEPLHYHRSADGQYVLYSIGWNEVDDGGQIKWTSGWEQPQQDFDNGDWVWLSQPQPQPVVSERR